jgi:hypothetical protein
MALFALAQFGRGGVDESPPPLLYPLSRGTQPTELRSITVKST